MRLTTISLLTGAALGALLTAQAAAAQTVGQPTAPASTDSPNASASQSGVGTDTSPTTDAQVAANDSAPDQSGDVVVLGFGQTRQVQSVTSADIARIVPGASPLKAIEKLPGVNFQSADAFGNYEWAVRISLRGFNQNQLGFTLDGIPLGDMSYGNVNGLHISRAIISENVARTEVAQGAGALGTASTSNLGGTIQFYSDDARDAFNVTGSGTYGSDSTYRGFARVDSGLIGDTVKGYVSYAYYKTDKWKGFGKQKQQQVNAKITADLGAMGDISWYFDYSDRHENDYQDLSLDLISRRGYKYDNISTQYALAQQVATAYQTGTPFPGGFTTVDDAYYDAAGLRRDYLGGFVFNGNLAPGLTYKGIGYYHVNKGQGSWFTPYVATPFGAPNVDGTPITNPASISYRTTEYVMHRGGAINTLTYEAGDNTLEVGSWYESNNFDNARRYYGLTADAPNRQALGYQSNPFFTQWAGKYDTTTLQYHVADTLKLADDKLVLNGGWKGFRVVNRAHLTTGTLAQGKIGAKDWFQPQVGALFHVTPTAEIFADYAENLRAFTSAGAGGPFSTTQAGFDAIRSTLKPERSKTVEGGARLRSGGLQASAVGYYVNFSNRLLAFSNGSGIAGNPPVLNNVGGVHTYGAEIAVNYRIAPPLSVFASYSYNHARYQDNVFNAAGTLLAATKGKTVTDTPEHMLKGEVVFDASGFNARVGADYMSRRYYTYLNDQQVPGRVLVDASIGYTFHGDGALHGFAIVGNVVNLTDKKYIATVGSNGYYTSGDIDENTLLAGSPRQFFVTVKKGF